MALWAPKEGISLAAELVILSDFDSPLPDPLRVLNGLGKNALGPGGTVRVKRANKTTLDGKSLYGLSLLDAGHR